MKKGNEVSAIVKFTPLPPAPEWVRKIKAQPKFNDLVEIYVRHLSETNPRFHNLISSYHNSHAIEGGLKWDDGEAARLIREYARETEDKTVGGATIALVVHALRVVLNRWGVSRAQRLNSIGDELENYNASSQFRPHTSPHAEEENGDNNDNG